MKTDSADFHPITNLVHLAGNTLSEDSHSSVQDPAEEQVPVEWRRTKRPRRTSLGMPLATQLGQNPFSPRGLLSRMPHDASSPPSTRIRAALGCGAPSVC